MARPRKQSWVKKRGEWIARVRVTVGAREVDRTLRLPAELTIAQRDLRLAQFVAEIAEHQQAATPTKTMSLRTYVGQWLADKAAHVRPKTAETYAGQLYYLLASEVVNDVVAANVTRTTVNAWCRWLEVQPRRDRDEPLSHDWITGCWRTAKQVLRDMAADVGIADPTARVRPPSGKRKHVRETATHTAEDAARVIQWAMEDPEKRRAPEVAMFISTGMRAGEIYALRERDIDFRRGTITLSRAVSFTGSRVTEGGTKTDLTRDVVLTAAVQSIIRAHLANLSSHPSRDADDHPAGPLVFPAVRRNKFGTWHRRGQSVYKLFDAAAEALALTVRLRPQVCRRTSARLWAQRDPKLAKTMHGWTTDEMVDHYAAPAHDEMRATAEEIWR